jgi:hypothetical protein
MIQKHSHIRIFLGEMTGQMLGAIYRAMLAACTSETYHQAREASAGIGPDMRIHYTIDMVKETYYLSVIFQKPYDRFIPACQFLIRFISARIMDRAAVKDIAAAIAGRITRYSFLERKAAHLDSQTAIITCP